MPARISDWCSRVLISGKGFLLTQFHASLLLSLTAPGGSALSNQIVSVLLVAPVGERLRPSAVLISALAGAWRM